MDKFSRQVPVGDITDKCKQTLSVIGGTISGATSNVYKKLQTMLIDEDLDMDSIAAHNKDIEAKRSPKLRMQRVGEVEFQ